MLGRSADAIERFKAQNPACPVVLQLSGTDIYDYLRSDPGSTLRSMELADRLIGLNDLAARAVPKETEEAGLRITFQSATPPDAGQAPQHTRHDSRGGDWPSARRKGPPARGRSGTPASSRKPHPHRAGWPCLHDAMGAALSARRSEGQQAVSVA